MSAGFFGNMVSNVMAPGINDILPGSNIGTITTDVLKNNMPSYFPGPTPGYQLPTPDADPGIPAQQPPSSDKPGNEQYFLQMRQSIESLNEAMKQIQGMKTPGGQYSGGGGAQMMKPGGFIASTDNAVGK